MGAVFDCDICFSHPPFKPSPLPLTPFVSLRGVFDICFITRACYWLCFFLLVYLTSAFALFFVLMGSLTHTLSIGIRVLLSFRLLAIEWELEGLGWGGNKKMRTWVLFVLLSLRIGMGFFLSQSHRILINLWHNYIHLYSE